MLINSTMKTIAQSAYDNGWGYIWVGITDGYENGKFRYWSSARTYDETGACWPTNDLDGITTGSDQPQDCAVVLRDTLDDQDCVRDFYAMCQIDNVIC